MALRVAVSVIFTALASSDDVRQPSTSKGRGFGCSWYRVAPVAIQETITKPDVKPHKAACKAK